jgi:DNA-binding HxlR family transcriptional regulator
VEDGTEVERDRQRAEVFDALGHPTRILILKVLSEGAVGFADLKKKIAIESSGHLQHHLTKLNGLIKTDDYGKYCLSDQGKDALLTVQTVENATSKNNIKEKTHSRYFNAKIGLKPVAFLLVALLITSSAIALLEYNQTSTLQRQIARFSGNNFEAMAYYTEFGLIPATNVNSSYAPPVSMYRALQIALETEGWNKTSLNGMAVGAYLMKWQTINGPNYYNDTGIISIDGSLSPPSDYSDVYSNGVIYQYVWQITVENSSRPTIPPIGFSLVDAATGQILPNPPLY